MRNITAAARVFCPLAERFACEILFYFQPKPTIPTSYMMGRDAFTMRPLCAGMRRFFCAFNITWEEVLAPLPTLGRQRPSSGSSSETAAEAFPFFSSL